ncbi:glycosyltransferase family 4 protein [Brevibacterium sp.]|jgi:glycosyltransferase involved in cell wall biosynthesis|uniref:glycosyltransferase family 4 protein n=1 Tax=Brevibacterium sp. TaxID=1701 RepID=UPI0025BF4F9E|nr:glycosyltransferase family 4 protein [Brevibacterium sp.]
MRILLVLGTSTGGVGTHVAAAARSFAAAGHRVGVVGPAATQEQFGFDDRPRVMFAPLEIPVGVGPRDAGTVRRLRTLIRTFRADVVHAHGFRASLLTSVALTGMRKRPRFLSSWHNTIMSTGGRERMERLVAARIARTADTVLGASEDLVDLARELGASHTGLAPAAAPSPRFGDDIHAGLLRARLARELGFDRDGLILLAVGRIAPQKDYGVLIDALAELAADHPEVQCLVAGAQDDAERARLDARIEEHARAGRRPSLHFLGQRGDVGALNQLADAFVLTSRWEARALVLQEALLTGKAIVATATGGTPGLVGDAGLLVPAGDPAAFAAALRRVVEDPALREELGHRAAQRALDLPDEAQAAELLLTEYEAARARG